MAEKRVRVELTASFVECLDSIESFLAKEDAHRAYDELVTTLRERVVPNLSRFPSIGKRYLDTPPQSVEALDQFSRLPGAAGVGLRQYLTGDYLILYSLTDSTAYLLSIRHHRQLSFDFGRMWPGS